MYSDELQWGQVAAVAVVAVVEAVLLVAVQLNVAGVEVEHDARHRHLIVCVDELLDEEALDVGVPGDDLFVSRILGHALASELKSVERALSSERVALVALTHPLRSGHIGLPDRGSKEGIAAQGVVVIQILVACTKRQDPLAQQVHDRVLDGTLSSVISEAFGETADNANSRIELTEQEHASVGRDAPGIEIGYDFAASAGLEEKLLAGTVCVHWGAPYLILNCLIILRIGQFC